jgi:hypothetical protein
MEQFHGSRREESGRSVSRNTGGDSVAIELIK